MQSDQLSASTAANKASETVKGISKDSSDEELENAVKSFESFFVEQILKEMKESIENINKDGDEDKTASMMTDLYMDSTIQQVAADLVEKFGDNMTETLVSQIKRSYGMTDTTSAEEALSTTQKTEET